MTKQTKMWLGIALVGVAGYMLYKQKPKASFASAKLTSKQKFNNFATASQVVDGRMSTPGKSKF